MYVGKIIELAPTSSPLRHPAASVYGGADVGGAGAGARGLRNRRQRIKPQGEVADPVNPPSGCYFHPRCRYAQNRCKVEEPQLREI